MAKKSDLERLQRELRDLLANDTENALERLLQVTQEKTGQWNKVREKLGTLKNIKDEYYLEETITRNEYKTDMAKLAKATLMLIERLTEDVLEKGWHLLAARKERIFIYAFDTGTRAGIEQVFDARIFPHARFAEPHELESMPPAPQDGEADWDIVVFSMMHYDREISTEIDYEARVAEMYKKQFRLFKDVKDKYFTVYYGKHYFRLNDWYDRVQGANSPFSLFARTEEMLEFLKKTGR